MPRSTLVYRFCRSRSLRQLRFHAPFSPLSTELTSLLPEANRGHRLLIQQTAVHGGQRKKYGRRLVLAPRIIQCIDSPRGPQAEPGAITAACIAGKEPSRTGCEICSANGAGRV